jgi:hypothetical protein
VFREAERGRLPLLPVMPGQRSLTWPVMARLPEGARRIPVGVCQGKDAVIGQQVRPCCPLCFIGIFTTAHIRQQLLAGSNFIKSLIYITISICMTILTQIRILNPVFGNYTSLEAAR